MPSFSRASKERLGTCDLRLQNLFNEVIKHFDCTIVCGYRDKDSQDAAFKAKASTVEWPNSKHNSSPSLAVDVVPSPIDWEDTRRFYMFVGIVRGIAAEMGIPIRCGADWDGDMEIKDQNFHDLPHFELLL